MIVPTNTYLVIRSDYILYFCVRLAVL